MWHVLTPFALGGFFGYAFVNSLTGEYKVFRWWSAILSVFALVASVAYIFKF